MINDCCIWSAVHHAIVVNLVRYTVIMLHCTGEHTQSCRNSNRVVLAMFCLALPSLLLITIEQCFEIAGTWNALRLIDTHNSTWNALRLSGCLGSRRQRRLPSHSHMWGADTSRDSSWSSLPLLQEWGSSREERSSREEWKADEEMEEGACGGGG